MNSYSTMMNHLNTLTASFKTMDEYPKEALAQATRDIVNGAGLITPTLRPTGNGFIGAYRATNAKRSIMVMINKNTEVAWDDFKETFTPSLGQLMAYQFNHDDQMTITAVFGADYWKDYRNAMLGSMTTENTFENCVRATWRCVMGDYLYWSTTAKLYLEAMENADTDLKRSIYAQKAKISYTHAEGIKSGFEANFPMATITDKWIERG
jgi:hypothetical protein